jgi:ABC-type transport system substrate-binding protein
VAALLSGDVNIIDELPTDQVDRVNSSPNSRAESAQYAGLQLLYVQSKVPPLDKKEVRQALSLGIDRAAIVKDLLRGQATVATGSIPRGDFGYEDKLQPLPYDPVKAKALLQQAGYNGETIVIEPLSYDKAISEAIAGMWSQIGVKSAINVEENSVRVAKYRDKSFKGVWPGGAGSPYGDPDGTMWRLLGPGGLWDVWRHEEFDRLGDQARFTLDAELRKRNYSRMQELLLEFNPWIPLWQPVRSWGVHKNIQWKLYFGGTRVEFHHDNLRFT